MGKMVDIVQVNNLHCWGPAATPAATLGKSHNSEPPPSHPYMPSALSIRRHHCDEMPTTAQYILYHHHTRGKLPSEACSTKRFTSDPTAQFRLQKRRAPWHTLFSDIHASRALKLQLHSLRVRFRATSIGFYQWISIDSANLVNAAKKLGQYVP